MRFVVFLHVLSAVTLGFYLLFPFLAARLKPASEPSGYAGFLRTLNRIGQFAVAAALLTGGSIVHNYGYSTAWMVVIFLLIAAMFAMTGMMGKPLRAVAGGSGTEKETGKIRTFSVINALCLLVILVLMSFPHLL